MKKFPYTKTESFDEAIARFKRNYDDAPDEYLKEYWQKQINNVVIRKEITTKAAQAIIESIKKKTVKEIRLIYPALLNCKEESRYFQFRIKKRVNAVDVINEFGRNMQSINVTCKDGIVRIFEIKIEAFWGRIPNRKVTPLKLVNVYFSPRDQTKKDNQISVE